MNDPDVSKQNTAIRRLAPCVYKKALCTSQNSLPEVVPKGGDLKHAIGRNWADDAFDDALK